ncbi:MAG: molybdenum cofactor guanylyltransferase [Chloroflexi bacterium]|nr:molybdenum cofactor guanylyltransferase [Chloroflexota bacterium]
MNGIILAGGKSSRMGTDKTMIDLGGKGLTEVVLETVSTLVDDIVIVTNSPQLFTGLPASLTPDVEPGAGPLGGILSGLLASQQDLNLVVACDMPFLNVELLRYMQALAIGFDIVIPRLQDPLKPSHTIYEPLHAIYSKACIEPARALVAQRNFQIIALLDVMRVRYIEKEEFERFDPLHLSFFNVNTPAELQEAREKLARREAVRRTT